MAKKEKKSSEFNGDFSKGESRLQIDKNKVSLIIDKNTMILVDKENQTKEYANKYSEVLTFNRSKNSI